MCTTQLRSGIRLGPGSWVPCRCLSGFCRSFVFICRVVAGMTLRHGSFSDHRDILTVEVGNSHFSSQLCSINCCWMQFMPSSKRSFTLVLAWIFQRHQELRCSFSVSCETCRAARTSPGSSEEEVTTIGPRAVLTLCFLDDEYRQNSFLRATSVFILVTKGDAIFTFLHSKPRCSDSWKLHRSPMQKFLSLSLLSYHENKVAETAQ